MSCVSQIDLMVQFHIQGTKIYGFYRAQRELSIKYVVAISQ